MGEPVHGVPHGRAGRGQRNRQQYPEDQNPGGRHGRDRGRGLRNAITIILLLQLKL